MDRRELTHDQVLLDLPAFVLGALDDDETIAISTHIDTCSMCRAEQAHLEETLGLIGTAVPSVAPSPELRARVLDALDTPKPRSLEDARPTQSAAPARWRRLTSFGLAAAAVLFIGLFTWTMVLRHDLNQTQGTLEAAQSRQSVDTELLANVSHMIPLVADNAPSAYGTLYIGGQSNQALLVVKDLPETPANEMYQIWLVNNSTRVTAGLFKVDTSGSATVMIAAPDPLTSYQSLGITAEPGPTGSSEPTSERIIGCALH